MQLTTSKVAFWLEKTSLLGWLKLLMLPVAVWFIYSFINSSLIPNTTIRVSLALVFVFSFFFTIERLSLWLSKLPGEPCLIATFDNSVLHLALDIKADFPSDKLLAVSFSEKTIFSLVRWPGKKNIINVLFKQRINFAKI